MLDVLFCFDERYQQHFGVAVTSLLINNPDVPIRVHLITKDLDTAFKHKLKRLADNHAVSFEIHEVDESKVQGLKVSAHISLAAYYRLIAPDLLPQNLDKILYLDSDVVVQGSISDLYNYELGDKLLAACGKRVVTNKKRLDLKNDYYFNSGVMLLNLSLWHNQDIGKQCIDYLRENPKIAKLWDQDALNKVIDGEFIHLNDRWNTLIDLYGGQRSQQQDYEVATIVHYVGSLKPWQSWCFRPARQTYWSYLRQSPWAQAKPELPNTKKALQSSVKSVKKQLLG